MFDFRFAGGQISRAGSLRYQLRPLRAELDGIKPSSSIPTYCFCTDI